ncbi:glycosyltransferase [Cetobacterium sp. SF1]|uniref:glycosyltransferase n=1 Tax=Cetobacterium sp. SF1 TaxID=3417654 RepID=UPI003CEA048D
MEKKIKVAFFIKGLRIGGTERVLISYLKGLAEDETFDIRLIIHENSSRNLLLGDVPKNIKIEYILSEKLDNAIEESSKNREKNILKKLAYNILMPYGKKLRRKKIIEYVEREKIDILVDFERSFIKFAEKIKCKKVLWNHFTFAGIKNKEIWVEYFNKYSKIIAISKEMEKEILEFYGEKSKVEMLYNPQYFMPIEEKARDKSNLTKEELELLEDKYICYIGRVEKVKGLEDLIEAYGKINVLEKLYIIGEGTEKTKLENLVKELKLEDRILFLGGKKNPFIWMRNSELFVTTTYGEGLPTTFIESMICGTPIMSYDCPTGPRDILGEGKYGKLIKMGDKENFSKELEYLLKNPEIIEKYREKIPEKIKEFSIENVIDKFKEILKKISGEN